MDWYRRQDFQRPSSGHFDSPGRPFGRDYAPSDFGDYRAERLNRSAQERISMRRYAPSDIGDYRTRPPMEPSPDYISGVPVYGQNLLPQNQKHGASRMSAITNQPNRHGTFQNLAFDPNDAPVYDAPYAHVGPGTGSNFSVSAPYTIYDGKGYKEIQQAARERPSWIDKMAPADKQTDKSPICTVSTVVRINIIILIVWDLANDWLLASSGPISFLSPDSDKEQRCKANMKLFNLTGINENNTEYYICSKSETVWNAFAILSLIGSLVTIIQIINIGCEIIVQCRPKVFQVLHGQSEVLLALFFEELPQIGLMTSMFFLCDCEEVNRFDKNPHLTVFTLLASISAAASTTCALRHQFSRNFSRWRLL